jgi:LysR family cyn operon transcriptional activator
MELRQLKYFLKAKELLNFTEAAAALNISQSTLSQQIKQLEDELSVPLFNRIGKKDCTYRSW